MKWKFKFVRRTLAQQLAEKYNLQPGKIDDNIMENYRQLSDRLDKIKEKQDKKSKL